MVLLAWYDEAANAVAPFHCPLQLVAIFPSGVFLRLQLLTWPVSNIRNIFALRERKGVEHDLLTLNLALPLATLKSRPEGSSLSRHLFKPHFNFF
jgi:hypothetical protein